MIPISFLSVVLQLVWFAFWAFTTIAVFAQYDTEEKSGTTLYLIYALLILSAYWTWQGWYCR